ncbi:polysaccharide biosynthesis protein [Nitrococcus mobilis]|uniref:Polysaccharide biosynthesis protein n=1 Tax=Nitrococcus mobilis Nb-231 TaxID=314278 RepID=A4BUR9_9GAMM|nr:nucleoside-diphosphate sugar epimerase/dehydratase [Nitrococcus mobilis]EAR20523.1 polysaccharide biosynthesis protein [Nitrococcus mobilis Nb-231]
MHRKLAALPRRTKQLIMVGADMAMLPLAVWSAFALRFGTVAPPYLDRFWWLFIATPLLTIPILYALGLYRAIVRYMSTQAVFAVVNGVGLSALLIIAMSLMLDMRGLPRSVVLLYALFALLYIGGSRFLIRTSLQSLIRRRTNKEPVVIYGAGAAGLQSAAALLNGNEYEPVAFVDDNPALQGMVMHGIKVHSPELLSKLAAALEVSYVLLAMPSLSRLRRNAILDRLEPLPVRVKTLPGLADLVSGAARVDEFREVDIEDLLGRDPVIPQQRLLGQCIHGKVVMVTGAGGTIGSELCRQILRLAPQALILYELSEPALYRIEQELQRIVQAEGIAAEVVPLLGSVTERAMLRRVMSGWGVHTVYHAAAYKHVPIVEHNYISGVRNNIFGTWYAAEAALAAGVERFVLVSTDKAVRPTNVMGASKRLAELVLQGLHDRGTREGGPATRFCMVRFGNVLGSSGSVVPLFREQIQSGGPVTVTDPEVTRYFMTIPEATALVIQAGAMGQGGDVFVLDMGDSVKIVDLARRMIHLAGYEVCDEENPDGDIAITFTGLRPGEKLYEELLIGAVDAPTQHPMIRQAQESFQPWPQLQPHLDKLLRACDRFNCEAVRKLLLESVSGFQPTPDIHDLIWQREPRPSVAIVRHIEEGLAVAASRAQPPKS